MNFNKEQFETLAAYEPYFKTATEANWCRYPGRPALEMMHAILRDAVNDRRRLNPGCMHCTLSLVKDTGRLWYQDRDARLAEANEKKAVELSKKKAATKKKVAIKTDK